MYSSKVHISSFILSRVADEVKPQIAGRVVAAVGRMPGQLFSGTLGLLRPSSAATKEKNPSASPTTEQAPPGFVQNSEAYADRLFVACIKRHVSRCAYRIHVSLR